MLKEMCGSAKSTAEAQRSSSTKLVYFLYYSMHQKEGAARFSHIMFLFEIFRKELFKLRNQEDMEFILARRKIWRR